QAGARAHARPLVHEPAVLQGDGRGRVRRRHDHRARHAGPDPRRHRSLMAIDPSKIKRSSHGSRVPGWDSAVDLTKDPSVVPDPATTYVPEHVREAIETIRD